MAFLLKKKTKRFLDAFYPLFNISSIHYQNLSKTVALQKNKADVWFLIYKYATFDTYLHQVFLCIVLRGLLKHFKNYLQKHILNLYDTNVTFAAVHTRTLHICKGGERILSI